MVVYLLPMFTYYSHIIIIILFNVVLFKLLLWIVCFVDLTCLDLIAPVVPAARRNRVVHVEGG